MLRCLFFIITALLLNSCAKPPLQELDAAEYMVGRAYAKQAAEFAPAEYQAARTALNDARAAMQDSDYGDARDSLDFSLQHARRAVVLAEETQARRLKEEKEQVRTEEEARLKALEERKQKAQSTETKKPTPLPKKVVKTKPKVVPASDYTVGDGENLWTISAQPEVYGEGLLWPLLYQANRDQIKDPRQIFPGQSLSIRRDMTEADLEDARQRARESDIFPVPPSTETEQ
ncbi:LysM peptidoglycan-binding domain-containing protein [Deltaproteobacteria bacterium IMCC39524]|nr:LysM peptidoglycan-binding domain-containing protein [Deltaproteobacteria bacterium IMCC39524]